MKHRIFVFLLIIILLPQIHYVLAKNSWTIETELGKGGVPACDPNVAQSSGYIHLPGEDGTQKHFFYWLFAPRHPSVSGDPPPVVLWLSGGPGCSSELALGVENGPCLVSDDPIELKNNPFGWNDKAYLLYVDQPIGTGYSYSESERNVESNEMEVATDMYEFLQQFASNFTSPSIFDKNSLYITGESYAGHYIPAIAHHIMEENQKGTRPELQLKGIAIGNGFTNAEIQYQSFPYYAYFFCQQALGAPCVTQEEYTEMVNQLPSCLEGLRTCKNSTSDEKESICAESMKICQQMAYPPSMQNRNRYDVRKACEGELCYSLNYLDIIFDARSVKAALGVHPGVTWRACSSAVLELYLLDYIQSFESDVARLLDLGVKVLLYEGDMDYGCNFIGNLMWVKSLDWKGREAFHAAPEVEFKVGERWGGSARIAGPLSFVRVYNAGHLVPKDQPEVALFLINRFIEGQTLIG